MTAALHELNVDANSLGIVIVDHGSRRDESNQMLLSVVQTVRRSTGWPIVEPAHMELAEPSIATAFNRVVQQGAQRVVVFPFFLGPGRHWREDIPRLAAQAAAEHAGVQYLVAAPLGLHPLMPQIIEDRVLNCLRHCLQEGQRCDVCLDDDRTCHLLPQPD